MSDSQKIRQAILAAPMETSNFGEAPQLGTLYAPLSHLKALRLDAQVVVGGRGVGKSFWTAALQSSELRATLGASLQELEGLEVRIGFASNESTNYPNGDAFAKLLGDGLQPYDIWRAVILRWVAEKAQTSIPTQSWSDTVGWLKQNSEAAVELMAMNRSWRGLIIFDALDRTSADWKQMDEIVRGLLRSVLWLRSHPGLHAKVFCERIRLREQFSISPMPLSCSQQKLSYSGRATICTDCFGSVSSMPLTSMVALCGIFALLNFEVGNGVCLKP